MTQSNLKTAENKQKLKNPSIKKSTEIENNINQTKDFITPETPNQLLNFLKRKKIDSQKLIRKLIYKIINQKTLLNKNEEKEYKYLKKYFLSDKRTKF